MANTDAPFGLVAIGTLSGADYRGMLREVEFVTGDSVACFVGDPIKLTGTTGTDGKTPVVAQATAGAGAVGVLVSLSPDFENEAFINAGNNRLASTARKGYALYGPDILYTCQEDSVGGALVAGDAGLNANFIVGTGDAVTGASSVEIDSSTINTTATLNLRLHYVDRASDNELGANAKWIVSINANQDRNTTGA
jgi:hypothetical protein